MKTCKQMIEALVARGHTQTAIGAHIGVSPQTICDILAERQKTLKMEPGAKLMVMYVEKKKS